VILRRFKQHVKTENWFAVVIDFLIVVVAVFIGLQASNWNEARLAKADESVLLDRLVRDLKAMEREASLKLDFLQGNLDRIEVLTESFREESVHLDSDQLALELQRILSMPGTVERSATYLELISGGMRRLSDDETRESIVRHDITLLDAKEFQAIRRQSLASYSQPLHTLKFLLVEKPTQQAIEMSGGNLELRLALLAVRDVYTAEQNQLLGVLQITRDTLISLGDLAESEQD